MTRIEKLRAELEALMNETNEVKMCVLATFAKRELNEDERIWACEKVDELKARMEALNAEIEELTA